MVVRAAGAWTLPDQVVALVWPVFHIAPPVLASYQPVCQRPLPCFSFIIISRRVIPGRTADGEADKRIFITKPGPVLR